MHWQRKCSITVLTFLTFAFLSPPSQATVAGRNGLIVYFDEASGKTGIWTLDPSTNRRHRLTSEVQDQGPSFSPDGSWIVFEHGGALALIRPDGTHKHILAQVNNEAAGPTWSPDGSRIVYSYGNSRPFGPEWLHVIRRDGTHDHSLNVDAFCPAWSPDGAWLTATIIRHYVSHIIRVRPDGSHEQQLTHYNAKTAATDGLGEDCADWAPDGKHLVYTRGWSDASGALHFAVHVMRPDGSGDHAITRTWSGQSYIRGAAYSPDGSRVVFSRNGHLYAIDANGGNLTQLAVDGRDFVSPSAWQPV